MKVVAVAVAAIGCGGGGGGGSDDTNDATPSPDARPFSPSAVVVGANGEIAMLDLEAPWAIRDTYSIEHPVVGVRYHDRTVYVVLDDDGIAVIDLRGGLPTSAPVILGLPAGDDPRDIAFAGGGGGVISLRGRPALQRFPDGGDIDLTPLAEPTEGVAAGGLAICGNRVFVQLQRPTTPGIGVIDVTPTDSTIVQTIPTAYPPAFVMPTACPDTLYVAEPIPLMLGGGSREAIDLATLTPAPLSLGDGLGEVGGFVMTGAAAGWFIHHTEFGPSPSSHLSQLPGTGGVWDTFTDAQVDHLALDLATNQVFFPDPCTTNCNPGHATGVQVFDATTAGRLTTAAIDVGFPPVDVVIAR